MLRGVERNGEEWRGIERNREEWRGMERNGEEWRGMERRGRGRELRGDISASKNRCEKPRFRTPNSESAIFGVK